MSYSRSYSATVTARYHDTITVNYPSSEHGGSKSVSVSGSVEVPVDVDIYVDTDRFDNNVDGCRRSVSGLNAAVVATTAAEIAAKEASSKKIGRTIVKGFFDYITSELSQLKSELSTKCDSILATLFEQKGACAEKSNQMADDYKRISTRYSKTFLDLDNELNNRIRAIDKPIFQINRDILSCSSRVTDTSLLGISTIVSAETMQLDAILAASSIKSRAKGLIDKTSDYLLGTYKLQRSIQDMLVDDTTSGFYMLPVVYVESSEESHIMNHKTYGASALPLKEFKGLEAKLITKFQDSSLSWSEIDPLWSEKIDSYFYNEFNTAELDARVAKVIMNLKSRNKYNVVKNVRV